MEWVDAITHLQVRRPFGVLTTSTYTIWLVVMVLLPAGSLGMAGALVSFAVMGFIAGMYVIFTTNCQELFVSDYAGMLACCVFAVVVAFCFCSCLLCCVFDCSIVCWSHYLSVCLSVLCVYEATVCLLVCLFPSFGVYLECGSCVCVCHFC